MKPYTQLMVTNVFSKKSHVSIKHRLALLGEHILYAHSPFKKYLAHNTGENRWCSTWKFIKDCLMFPMVQHLSGHLIFSTISLYHYNMPLITKHLRKSTRMTHYINFGNLLLTYFLSFLQRECIPFQGGCFLISCQLIVLSFYCAPCCRAVGYVVSSQFHTGVRDHLSIH